MYCTIQFERNKVMLCFVMLYYDFFNFSDSFFNEQFNLESENRFDLLAKGHETLD